MKGFKARAAVNILFFAAGASIVIYMVYKLSVYTGKIDFSSLSFNIPLLLFSFALSPLWFILQCYVWKSILAGMNANISILDSMRVIGLSMFGKYIPGKVWFTVGRTVLAEKLGVPKKKAFTAVILETYLLVMTGMLFIIPLILRLPQKPQATVYFSAAAVGLLIPFLHPRLFMKIINFALKKLKKQTIDEFIPVSMVAKAVFLYLIVWLMMGVQFSLLIISFCGKGVDVISLLSVYPASWTLAFIVLVVPAGIGLREGTIYFFLSQIVSQDSAIYGALLSRIEITAGELLYLLLLLGSGKLWRRNDKREI